MNWKVGGQPYNVPGNNYNNYNCVTKMNVNNKALKTTQKNISIIIPLV